MRVAANGVGGDPPEGLGTGRFRRFELEILTVLTIIVLSIVFGRLSPSEAQREMIDHRLFRLTVESMWDGSSYYAAMNSAQEVVYGPERTAVTETVRGYRMPTTFLVWRILPDERAIWVLFVSISAVTGLVAMRLVRWSPLAILPVAYMLTLGILRRGDVWTAQFMTTELWALPAMAGAVLAGLRRRWWPAALLALLAFLIRETTAGLLLTGVALAMLGRVPKKPFLSVGALAIAAYASHAFLAAPFLDPRAVTPLPMGGEIPMSFLRMVGFGLPAGPAIGLLLWLLAIIGVRTTHPEPLLAGSYLAFPLIGILVEREYWGILVVPFTLLWGFDEIARLMERIRVRRPGPRLV